MNPYLTNKELIRASQDYFQKRNVKNALNKRVALLNFSGSIVLGKEKEIIHDVDLFCFKKRGVRAGKFLTETTKLIKKFNKFILKEYSVNVTAFPNFTLQAEAETFCKHLSEKINAGLNYNVWEDINGKMSKEEIKLYRKYPKIKGILPLHIISYASSTDFKNDSFAPEKFRISVLKKNSILFGSAENINKMDEKNDKNKTYIDAVMRVERFNCINSNYPEIVQSQKIGLIIDYMNKHIFGKSSNFQDKKLSRQESEKLYYNFLTKLDNFYSKKLK